MKPIISMVVAIGQNREMGKGDDLLPWDIPEDAKFYRDKTRWHVNIMGRKTFESLSKFFHGPPPKRINVVLTGEKDYDPQEMVKKYEEYHRNNSSQTSQLERISYAFTDVKEALEFAKKEEVKLREELKDALGPEVMVVGGAQIFKLCMPYTDRIYITKIDAEFPQADIFFPESSDFKKVISERKSYDQNYTYTFITLER